MKYEKTIVRLNGQEIKIVVKHFSNGNITRVIHSVFVKISGKWESPVESKELMRNGVDKAPKHAHEIYLEHVTEQEILDAQIESFQFAKNRSYASSNN